MKKFLVTLLLFPLLATAQITNRLIGTQNIPLDVSANNYMFTVPPIDNRIYVAKMDSLKLHPYNIVGLETYLYLKGDTRYKSITYTPSFVEIVSGLGFNPYPATNPSGYISSYTETDPLVSAYVKSLTSFTVIKSDTDLLYKSINYTPTSLEITTSLGYTPLQTESDPVWSGVSPNYRTKTQNDLLYEPIFSKNSAFNKNFGTTSNTVAEGNDGRINNGQTAFSWGNHASAGYITPNSTNNLTNKSGNVSQWTNDSGYLTTITSAQVTSALEFTPLTNSRTITINGVSQDLSTNRIWSVGDLLSTGSYVNPSWLTSLAYGKLTGAPTIPAAQVNSDWNSISGLSQILNKPTLATVATSGSYNDLSSKPTIPTNNNQLTNGNAYIDQAGARTSISLTTTGNGVATYSNSTGILNIPTPPANTDYTNTVSVAGGAGNAVFYLTSDKTSTGTALYTTVTYVNPIVNDSNVNYTYSWSYNSGTKALTVNTKSAVGINVALLSLTLLGVPSPVANGTPVSVFVKGN